MLIIKRKVNLEFLGEEYKDSYISLRAISVGEYDNLKGTVKDEIIERFIDGEIHQDSGLEKITKENITELPGEVFVKAFEAIAGANPKDSGSLTMPSSMEPQSPLS